MGPFLLDPQNRLCFPTPKDLVAVSWSWGSKSQAKAGAEEETEEEDKLDQTQYYSVKLKNLIK